MLPSAPVMTRVHASGVKAAGAPLVDGEGDGVAVTVVVAVTVTVGVALAGLLVDGPEQAANARPVSRSTAGRQA